MGQGNAQLPTTTVSGGGQGLTGLRVGKTYLWLGMSDNDIATLSDRYATPTHLNKVGAKANMTGGRDVSCSQLVGGIGPLRIRMEAK